MSKARVGDADDEEMTSEKLMQLELEKKKEKESKIQALKDQEENELVINVYVFYAQWQFCIKWKVPCLDVSQLWINPNGGGGFVCARTVLDGYFAMKKESGGPKFQEFS